MPRPSIRLSPFLSPHGANPPSASYGCRAPLGLSLRLSSSFAPVELPSFLRLPQLLSAPELSSSPTSSQRLPSPPWPHPIAEPPSAFVRLLQVPSFPRPRPTAEPRSALYGLFPRPQFSLGTRFSPSASVPCFTESSAPALQQTDLLLAPEAPPAPGFLRSRPSELPSPRLRLPTPLPVAGPVAPVFFLLLFVLLSSLPGGVPELVHDHSCRAVFLWSSTAMTCSWLGVSFQSGCVTVLRLPAVGLISQIPAGTVGHLTVLWMLSLRPNALSGSLPSDLAKCSHLRNFYLQSNRLSGEISAFLFSLQELVRLNLAANNFSDSITSLPLFLSLSLSLAPKPDFKQPTPSHDLFLLFSLSLSLTPSQINSKPRSLSSPLLFLSKPNSKPNKLQATISLLLSSLSPSQAATFSLSSQVTIMSQLAWAGRGLRWRGG